MAVGAHEDALRRLGSSAFKRSRETSVGERERLGLGIDVVELQRSGVARIAAQHARSAGFLEEDLLDATPTIADGLSSAPPAAPVAVAS